VMALARLYQRAGQRRTVLSRLGVTAAGPVTSDQELLGLARAGRSDQTSVQHAG
jgi:hypothetical protein